MICPLRAGSAGSTHDCMVDNCAWWDSALNQCCIKTMSIVPMIVHEMPKAVCRTSSWADEMRTRN